MVKSHLIKKQFWGYKKMKNRKKIISIFSVLMLLMITTYSISGVKNDRPMVIIKGSAEYNDGGWAVGATVEGYNPNAFPGDRLVTTTVESDGDWDFAVNWPGGPYWPPGSSFTVYINQTNQGSHFNWKGQKDGVVTEPIPDMGTVILYQPNQPPLIDDTSEIPTNGSTVYFDTNEQSFIDELSADIEDPEGDDFNWTIESSPTIGSNSGTDETNGTKTCTVSGLDYDTNYTWYVNATDEGSGETTSNYFWFKTEENDPPTADFNWTPQVIETWDIIQFNDLSTDIDGYIVSYLWDFDDGNSSTDQNPTHQYSDDGDYNVNLTVTDNNGKTDSVIKIVTVLNQNPSADFTYTPSNPNTTTNLQFTDTSTDIDGTVQSWFWDFDDGNTSTDQNPTHSYSLSGTYNVNLTVTDDNGDTDSIEKSITITAVPPVADFTWTPTTPETLETVSFTDTSTDSDGTITDWFWDFDDGNTSTAQHPTHTYSYPGFYQVNLTVTDSQSLTDSVINTIEVTNQAPIANDDQANSTEDTILWISVLANDYDVDGSIIPSTVTINTDASSGNTTINSSTGEIEYCPDFEFSGIDTFTYTVEDNNGTTSNIATVTITVLSENDPPVAVDDSYTTDEDTALIKSESNGVLANDYDNDTTILTAILDTNPDHGTLTLNSNGSFIYNPDKNYYGSDFFIYYANDGNSNSNQPATVYLTINPVEDGPEFSNPNPMNQSIGVNPDISELCVDIEDPEGENFFWTITTTPNIGSNSGFEGAGNKCCPVSNLQAGTSYTWYVTAEDADNDMNSTMYTFTTDYAPTLSNETPENESTITDIYNLTELTIDITDDEGDNIYWIIETSPDIGSNSGFSSGGTKTCPVSGLQLDTEYTWYVSARDIGSNRWTNRSYKFDTDVNDTPTITNPDPADEESDVDINKATVSVTIEDSENDPIDWTIEGSYLTNESANGEGNGVKSADLITPLPYDTEIIWFVNATDPNGSNKWNNKTYSFTTRADSTPEPPTQFTAEAISTSQIDLSWSKGTNADHTYIEWNNQPSWNRGEGIMLYNGSAETKSHFGLSAHTMYYYQAWSYNETDCLWSNTYAADNTTTLNNPPSYGIPTPSNNSDNHPTSLTWSILITDADGDSIDWNITCSNGQSMNATGPDGIKDITLQNLAYDTTYTVWVNSTDSYDYTREWFVFTTRSPGGAPLIFNPLPVNNSRVSRDFDQLSIIIQDPEGESFDWWITTSPDVGDASNLNDDNGTKTCSLSTIQPGQTYMWFVKAKDDTGLWTNTSYHFRVNNPPQIIPPPTPLNGSTNIDPDDGDPDAITTLSILIEDPEGDDFDWSITTTPDIESNSSTDDTNGTKTCSITNLQPFTTYRWDVYVDDGYDSISKWYKFTTIGNTPIADFSYTPTNPAINETIYFTDNSIDPDGGNIVTWSWEFGDGETSLLQNPAHIFEEQGSYQVNLTITDDEGENDTYSEVILVGSSCFTFSDIVSGWNLISLPFNSTLLKEDVMIFYNNELFTWSEAVGNGWIDDNVFGWNKQGQYYQFPVSMFEPGKGYWLYSYQPLELRICGVNISNPDNVIADIVINWNLIGTPFYISLEKSNLQINHQGMDYSWSEAVSNGWIDDNVFGWNKQGQYYQFPVSTFEPGKGYWMYAYDNCILKRDI